MTFKEILELLAKESPPADSQHYFMHGARWKRGDKFNYRIYAGLLLIDPKAAKLYFQTTS